MKSVVVQLCRGKSIGIAEVIEYQVVCLTQRDAELIEALDLGKRIGTSEAPPFRADSTSGAIQTAEDLPKRTKAEVLRLQRTRHRACCNRFADQQGCSCLEEAVFDDSPVFGDRWKCDECGTVNGGKAAKCMGCGG